MKYLNMNTKLLSLIIFLAYSTCISSQSYRTQPIGDDIHSIEVLANKQWNSYPIIKLNSDDYIHIGFDNVSEDTFARLRYKIVFCDADWQQNKEMSAIEYLDGFDDNIIEDNDVSVNTSVLYTHYNLQIPNADVTPKLSGNYAVLVYEEGLEDDILLTACFSVLDDVVSIAPEISSVTDIDSNKEHHQLTFDLNYKLNLRDVKNDFKVFVRQNNRLDSEVRNVKPNYIMPAKLRYRSNRNLIFEAGNEYHRFDMSSYKFNGKNVAHIEFKRPNYHMHIVPNKINNKGSYSYDQDQNGRVIFRNTESEDVEKEGDYFFAHLTLHADNPLPNDVYINGAFTYNTFSDRYKMKYDSNNREYSLSLLLKQGIYNYQYLTKNEDGYSASSVDGNFYETENEYSIYVYYRPVGQKYDSLVGFSYIQSRSK